MVDISIAIFDDAIAENDEQFAVVLNSFDTNVRISVNQTVVTIINDDGMLPQSRGTYVLQDIRIHLKIGPEKI